MGSNAAKKIKSTNATVDAPSLDSISAAAPRLWTRTNVVIGLLILLLPLWPLLLTARTAYSTDWKNHYWMADHITEYFRAHLSFPSMINTNDTLGIGFPLFYGYLFYPLIAVLGFFLGTQGGIDALLVAVTALQFIMSAKLVFRMTQNRFLALLFGGLVIGAAYPLTNLYNRGAITEYFAVSLQHLTLCTFGFALLRPDGRLHKKEIAFIAFALAWIAGTHVITALLTLVTLPLVYVGLRKKLLPSKDEWKGLALALVPGIILLIPWLYLFATYNYDLQIALAQKGWMAWPDSIDNLWTRLALIPTDVRTNGLDDKGLLDVSTPFLDAQANMPLFLLAVTLALGNFRSFTSGLRTQTNALRLVVIGLLTFAGFVFASTATSILLQSTSLTKLLVMIQFPYRFTTYCTLGIVLLTLGVLRSLGERAHRLNGPTQFLILVLAALGVGNVIYKETRIFFQPHEVSSIQIPWKQGGEGPLYTPEYFYGLPNYSTPLLFEEAQRKDTPTSYTPFRVGSGPEFAIPRTMRINAPETAYAYTDVLTFPWNKIYLNGKLYNYDRFATVAAVLLPPGESILEYRYEPPVLFTLMRWLAFAVFFGWLAWLLKIYWPRRP